jgi:enoyl-CoA hydratase/carnithine racemase
MQVALLFDVQDHIATITINRPEARNALDPETIAELAEAWARVRDDPDVRVAILTGAGDRAFCAGADLAKPADPTVYEEAPGGLKSYFPFDLKGIQVFKPIIAAVNGHAIGSGTEMLSGTDIRIAAEHATFGLPEITIGLIPFGGSVARLVRQIPYCEAMKLLLTGQRVSAAEALRIGLVNEVLPGPEVLPRARALAAHIRDLSPYATRSLKECVLRSLNGGLDAAYALESLYGERVGASEDAAEAQRALVEKRRPLFKNR